MDFLVDEPEASMSKVKTLIFTERDSENEEIILSDLERTTDKLTTLKKKLRVILDFTRKDSIF